MAGVPHLSKHSTMYCVIVVNYVVHVYVIEVYYSKKFENLMHISFDTLRYVSLFIKSCMLIFSYCRKLGNL